MTGLFVTWELIAHDRPPAYIEAQGASRRPGMWFGCEQPERLPDRDLAYHDGCRACAIGARAAALAGLVPGEVARHLDDRLDRWGEAPRLGPVEGVSTGG